MAFLASRLSPNRFVTTTATAPWTEKALGTPTGGLPADIVITLDACEPAQTVAGFGGCFNEQGWAVLNLLEAAPRAEILRALFDPAAGCCFNLCRLPMGASDYSLDWHSFDETPEDFDLEHFSIARDRQGLIPYLRAALQLNPSLRLWASPWCPPAWMKTNRHYAGRPGPLNDLPPAAAGTEMVTQFRMEPRVLDAYARYFARFLDAYHAEGITISAVHVQNEPNSAQNFPSCVWRPEDLATFIGGYLGPRFAAERRKTAIWLGTIERPQLERVTPILDADAGRYVHGVGFQWAGRGAIEDVHRRYPSLPLMQTETECGDGANDWNAAQHTWELLRHYFRHGAGAYMYWNMILDETGNSRWGWRQNAMITVDRRTLAVRYNPEFYLMQHVSHFVRPGAKYLGPTDATLPALLFRNPDDGIVVIVANSQPETQRCDLRLGSQNWTAEVPPCSFATIALSPSP